MPKYRLAIVLAGAILGKIVYVHIAPRGSGSTTDELKTLGALMNTRALMELIVLNGGYEFGFFLPPSDFAIPVLMAVVTTLMTGPLLAGGRCHASRITWGRRSRLS